MGVFWKNIEKTGTECQGFLFGDSVPASFGFSQILLQEKFKKTLIPDQLTESFRMKTTLFSCHFEYNHDLKYQKYF